MIFGNESSGNTTGRQNENGSSILFVRRSDGREGKSFGSLRWSRSEFSQLVEEGWVADCGFGQEGSFGHHRDYIMVNRRSCLDVVTRLTRFERVLALCGFS